MNSCYIIRAILYFCVCITDSDTQNTRIISQKTSMNELIGPSEVRAPAVGVAHAGGERSVHY
jgi:hypothetical protein